MIRLAIFDLEDTLCDHSGSHRRAQSRINVVLREAGLPVEKFWSLFNDINPGLQASVVAGFMGRRDYLWHRFSDVCGCLERSVGVLPDVLGEIYSEETVRKVRLFDDVLETFKAFQDEGIDLAVISDGDSASQREKFRRLGLGTVVDARRFFVSEELGFSKSEPAAYRQILAECGVCADAVLMVGDSVEEDIWGAEALGMRAILLDRGDVHGAAYAGTRVCSLSVLREICLSVPPSTEDLPTTTETAPAAPRAVVATYLQ